MSDATTKTLILNRPMMLNKDMRRLYCNITLDSEIQYSPNINTLWSIIQLYTFPFKFLNPLQISLTLTRLAPARLATTNFASLASLLFFFTFIVKQSNIPMSLPTIASIDQWAAGLTTCSFTGLITFPDLRD